MPIEHRAFPPYLDGRGDNLTEREKGGTHMSEPAGAPQPLLVSFGALTVVSGFVDAVSYLGLGHVFTANMTGNVVLIGFAVAGAPGFSIAASLCALGTFLAGAVVGGRLARHVSPARTLLLVALTFEATFTAVAAVVTAAAGAVAIGSGWPRFTVIALLAFAMGVRNAAVRHFGVADMTTTVLTMTLTGLASDSSLAGGTNPNSSAPGRLGALHVRGCARGSSARHPRASGLGARHRGRHRGVHRAVLRPGGPARVGHRQVAARRRACGPGQRGRPSSR